MNPSDIVMLARQSQINPANSEMVGFHNSTQRLKGPVQESTENMVGKVEEEGEGEPMMVITPKQHCVTEGTEIIYHKSCVKGFSSTAFKYC